MIQKTMDIKQCPLPSPHFTGREDILQQMRVCFSEQLGRRHVFVLFGLGGAGKTQTAYKFVAEWQHREDDHMRYVYLPLLIIRSDVQDAKMILSYKLLRNILHRC